MVIRGLMMETKKGQQIMKIGDTVKCVSHYDTVFPDILTVGKTYVVTGIVPSTVTKGYYYVKVKANNGSEAEFYRENFCILNVKELI